MTDIITETRQAVWAVFKRRSSAANCVALDSIERECESLDLDECCSQPYIMRHLCHGVRFCDGLHQNDVPTSLVDGLTLRKGVWEELEAEFNNKSEVVMEQEGEEGEEEAEKEEETAKEENGGESVGSDDPDGDDDDHPKWKHKRKPGETRTDFLWGDAEPPQKKKKKQEKKRGPGVEAKPMFAGNHAKVLTYYQELGNFQVEHSEIHDELLVVPRATIKQARKSNHKSFKARFGKHFRKIGFLPADDRNDLVPRVAFYMPNYSQNPIDMCTLELPRDRAAENEAMLDTDVFA